MRILRSLPVAFLLASLLSACGTTGPSAAAIDNSTLGQAEFRTHQTTYGVVYLLPQDVTSVLDAKVNAPLKQHLLKMGLQSEVDNPNLPHVTVVHIHSADPSTPQKMLKALPKPPTPIRLTLKTFYTTEAAKGAGHPWWLDLGIVKSGQGFEDMMAFNTRATAAMAPLRDGPLPRVTGPVYAKMAEPGRELVKTMGVSGVNVMQDGKELRAHNPHNTLVYSMALFTPALQSSMNQLAEQLNGVLPNGIDTTFREVSIVELAFAGNVTRELYRISLVDGSVVDMRTGARMSR